MKLMKVDRPVFSPSFPQILCDLDGTLANCNHRLHYIQGDTKDWDSFYLACDQDTPINPVINLLVSLHRSHEILILTGRSETVRIETMTWLKHHKVPYDHMIMRPKEDHSEDHNLKKRWILSRYQGYINQERVAFALEDRTRVVKMYRALGVPCFQVADGDF